MLSVLVVTEVLSIDSEKVTDTLSVTETPLWLSVGDIDKTVAAVVSTMNVVIVSVLLKLPVYPYNCNYTIRICPIT